MYHIKCSESEAVKIDESKAFWKHAVMHKMLTF